MAVIVANWSLKTDQNGNQYIIGDILGHSKYADNRLVSTDAIVNVETMSGGHWVATTVTGKRYTLFPEMQAR